MNDGIRKKAKAEPFTKPQESPTKIALKNPNHPPCEVAILAPIIPERATTDPTERSMLPATITNVIPNPMVIVTALCCNIRMMFFKVGNFVGAKMVNNPRTTNSDKKGIIILKLFLLFVETLLSIGSSFKFGMIHLPLDGMIIGT